MDRRYFNRRHNCYVQALLHELFGCDPAITTIVAKASQDGDIMDLLHMQSFMCDSRSRPAHEFRNANACLSESFFHPPDVLHIEHWLHNLYSLLYGIIRQPRGA